MTNCVSSSATQTVRLRVRLLLLLFVTSNAAVYPKTARTPRERQQHLRPQQEQQRFQRESTRITPDKQEKSCNACIEAAEAWRENFVCGASMALDVDWTPSGIIESNTCPEVLRCKGFYVDDDLVVCENLKKSMMDQEVYETIYEALSEFKPTSKYEDNQARIAEEIKEGGDPEIYANNNRFMYWKAAVKVRDKTMCDDTAKPCREALLGPLCRDDPSCDLARTVCDANCRIAYYLLTKWFPLFPNFKNDMSPKCTGGKERQSIYGKDETIDMTGIKQPKLKDCFEKWIDISNSAKARYLIQYVDRFGPYDWNPLTACQCLQLCKYDSIEAFDMASSCDYEEIEVRTASLFPDLMSIPGSDSSGIVRETKIV